MNKWTLAQDVTLDCEGYVYYKDRHVEHYSHNGTFSPDDDKRAAAEGLRQRCLHLESLGIAPSSRTAVWYWEWFENLTTETATTELINFLQHTPGFYEKTTGDGAKIIVVVFSACTGYLVYPTGRCQYMHRPTTEAENEAAGRHPWDSILSYHPLNAKGYDLAKMGQGKDKGTCYATTDQLLTWLKTNNVPLIIPDLTADIWTNAYAYHGDVYL